LTPVVLDASAALHLLAASEAVPASPLALHAPRLLRSEVLSAIHARVWRGVVPPAAAQTMLRRLDGLAISLFDDEHLLHARAWTIADELGWAKTYDAEYVALAQILGIPLLTVDGRLARKGEGLVDIVGPVDVGL
jgi:predicted nucleic acid-binding protein